MTRTRQRGKEGTPVAEALVAGDSEEVVKSLLSPSRSNDLAALGSDDFVDHRARYLIQRERRERGEDFASAAG